MFCFRGIIYEIVCLVDGKRYIGATTRTVRKRWYEHCWGASTYAALNQEPKSVLYRAITMYGKNAFELGEIACALNASNMFATEALLIQQLNTMAPNGMNTTAGNLVDLTCGYPSSGYAERQLSLERMGYRHHPDVPFEATGNT